MTKAEEIAKKWGILYYESGEVNKDVLEALNEALRQPPVIRQVCTIGGECKVRSENNELEVEEKLMDAKELATIFMKHINLELENGIAKVNKSFKNQQIKHGILFGQEWNDKLENAINLVIENNLKNK